VVRRRPCHILQANKTSDRPTRMLFVDIESYLTKVSPTHTRHDCWLMWTCYWRIRRDTGKDTRKWRFIEEVSEFWDYVDSLAIDKMTLRLIAHNAAYDLGVMNMFTELPDRGWSMSSIYTKSMTSILKWRKGKKKLVVLDNGNFFPGSLANLGEAIGFPKDDIDPTTATREEIIPYCKRDVEIMVKAWEWYLGFLDEHDLGNWGVTLPSQAFKAYRHRFMPHEILIHNDPRVLAMEREAYKGGRTSVFYRGTRSDGPFYHLDVNSMYPSVMIDHPYPRKLKHFHHRLTPPELRMMIRNFCVVARVRVKTDIPVFPVSQGGHNVYPVGEFDTTLTTPEVAFGFERGLILKVYEVAQYEQAGIFDDYVRFFYDLKQRYKEEHNRPFYLMVKLYLNSLYGKFGQKATKWEKRDDLPKIVSQCDFMYDPKTGKKTAIYNFGGQIWTCSEKGEGFNSFPAIAGHVTAYARVYLRKLQEQAGIKHFLYVDTDGFIVDQEGKANLDHLLNDTELGKLKVEVKADEVEILAPKYYREDNNWKRKGVPKKAKEIAPNVFECERFPSFLGIGHQPPGTPYFTTRYTKTMSLRIYDGAVKGDGWVTPLKAEEMITKKLFDPDKELRLAELTTQIETLKESRIVPASLVMKLWDYKSSNWKRVRTRRGELVPLEYSQADTWATEAGFADLESLKDAVQRQGNTDMRIKRLETQAWYLKER